uniref:Transforming protein v-Fos/v-Fox n=1 Tax=Schistocephalus solidus TaxID=70667 RepID=A0A0X3Q732_SCHSO
MMSSVANNHSSFSQHSLINRTSQNSFSPSPPPSQVPFFKRDPVTADCHSDRVHMRSRHPSDYPTWSPLSQMSSPQWMNETTCDTATSHVGSLPAAHNLLSFAKTSPSVLTNQNGKTFTTVGGGSYSSSRFNNPGFSSSTAHYEQSLPSPISSRSVDLPYTPLKREVGEVSVPIAYSQGVSAGSLSTPSCISGWDKGVNEVRSVYSANTPSNGCMAMDFVESHCPPGSCDPTTTGYPMNQASKVFRSSASSNACAYANGDGQYGGAASSFPTHPAEVGGEVLKPGHVASSNGFNTRSTKYSTTRYSIGPDSTIGSTAASIVSSDGETTTSSSANRGSKKTRKPAPTLATGRRNLKSEPVDADEADRRLKRRERNRKSAQKCRERKLHRTQELQAQVDGLNAEANRLLREVESWRDQARRCVQLLQQHCPGVAIPYLTCLVEPPDIFLPLPEGGPTATVAPNLPPPPPAAPPSFCDLSETEVCFYKSRMQYDAPTGAEAVGSAWHPSGASGPTTDPGLPPMSHLVHNSQPPPRRQPSPAITVSTSSMRSFIPTAAPGLEVSYSQSAPGATTGDPPDPTPAAPHRPCSLSAPTSGSYWAAGPSPDEVAPPSVNTGARDPTAWHVEAKQALSSSI